MIGLQNLATIINSSYVDSLLYCNFRYESMKRCWNFGPNDRPCFADLVQDINQAFTDVQELPPAESDQNFGYLKVH